MGTHQERELPPIKNAKEEAVLLTVIALYLEKHQPIGSETVQKESSLNLSASTIRNYFAKLEEKGYLEQKHTSGGRVPTEIAFCLLSQKSLAHETIPENYAEELDTLFLSSSRELASLFQKSVETLSAQVQGAVFLSTPRFDHDFVVDLKLVNIDSQRIVCVIVTDFGLIYTETLYSPKMLSHFQLKRIETYFQYRLTHINPPTLSPEELNIAKNFYKEIMLRHLTKYAHFNKEDLYRSGLSPFLNQKAFTELEQYTTSLALFEDDKRLRHLLKEAQKRKALCISIGNDLAIDSSNSPPVAVVAAPYYIHEKPVGAVAFLMPYEKCYKEALALLKIFSKKLSTHLTSTLYKFKLTYREPEDATKQLETTQKLLSLQEEKHDQKG